MRKFFLVILIGLFSATALWSQTDADFKRTEDVIYGRKAGVALTMDVFQPRAPNGIGIIFVVSGGWFSSHDAINSQAYLPFLNRGYTIFAVVHGSQPKYIIPEIMQDMHRSVRFIRHHAADYGIDPKRIGVTGGSAGGHLSLILGTQAGANVAANPKDPVNLESSAVQCVACFFPPTDFLNYGETGHISMGTNVLAEYRPAFGPLPDTEGGMAKYGREISPIYSITSNLPPTLIIHGDADHLVPIQQSEIFVKRAQEVGATAKLVVRESKGHGWPEWFTTDMNVCADWFDEHLRGKKN